MPADHDLARQKIDQDELMRYIHHEFNDSANDMEQNAKWVNLLNNAEGTKNDNLRIAACVTITNRPRLLNLIRNLLFILRRDELFGEDTDEMFATSSSGLANSINLLMSLEQCSRQKDHFDYDPQAFKPVLNYADAPRNHMRGSYMRFQGASLFINFSWTETQTLDLEGWDTKNNRQACINIPPMGLLVISGDLKHAGSANPSNKRTRKFFLYLDPIAGVRERAVKTGNKGGYVYFDYSCIPAHQQHQSSAETMESDTGDESCEEVSDESGEELMG
jgi:hypothetical protein